MTPASYLEDESERSGRHMLLLAAAVALSFVVHMVVIHYIADWQLESASVPKTPDGRDEEKPVLRVTNLPKDPIDPMEVFDRPASGGSVQGSGNFATPGGLPLDNVGALARAPDLTLATPPPPPRPAMRSELARIPAPELNATAENIWVPRQKIMEVVEARAREDLIELPRRLVPKIERIVGAPDYVPPAAVLKGEKLSVDSPLPVPKAIAELPATQPVVIPSAVSSEPSPIELPPAAEPANVAEGYGASPAEVEEALPLDDRLEATLTTRRYADDPDTVYFRLSIDRRDAAELPVAPKDLVFAQDCSKSLAPERLGFCRKALAEALATLGPEDRFNVAGFNDSVKMLFADWSPPTPDAVQAADDFIAAMKSEGETDVYASLDAILKLPRDPRRPMIILLVTDGRATVGPTESTGLIGELSRDNDGAVSIFTIGTHANANSYLLEMLAFCNRGESKVVKTRRWDIPDAIKDMASSLRRPVLSGVTYSVPAASGARIFPKQASNMYADRPLQFYGSIPASESDVIVQVRGVSTERDCDVILRMPIAESSPADAADDLRGSWARQRMYDLIGTYAKTGDRSLLAEMNELSERLRIPIPYRNEL